MLKNDSLKEKEDKESIVEGNKIYYIKEVTKILSCNANAIRFYEEKGLIQLNREENGYRIFREKDIQQLQFILLYRKLGFSLEVIKEICNREFENSNDSLLDIYSSQYRILNNQIHRLINIRNVIGEAVESILETNQIQEDIKERFEETLRTINQSNQWKDLWNFDSWANEYDAVVERDDQGNVENEDTATVQEKQEAFYKNREFKERDGLPFYRNYSNVIEATATAAVVKGDKILEIGIGTGNLCNRIMNKKEVEYVGVDQSIEMLRVAKSKLPQVSMKLGTFLQLPVDDNEYDVVVNSYAFHHCNEHEKILAIQEMDRVLNCSGRMIITDVMFYDMNARNKYYEQASIEIKEDMDDEYFGTVKEIEEYIKRIGYKVKSVQLDEVIWMVMGVK